MPSVTTLPFVLQEDFISVLYGGKSHPVSKGQPTFKALHRALLRKQWNRVPKLLSVAATIAEKSHGKVTVTANGVAYKGQPVDNTLTAKILELLDHGKSVSHMLKFMDNLYLQPDMATVNEVYEWLATGRFAMTDDGCFLAYKVVDGNYMDKHTHTVDNHIGQRPLMARSSVDPSRSLDCSDGYHFCSKGYIRGFYSPGDHIMGIKVNPADVVAIPSGGYRCRTWTYEVICELSLDELLIHGQEDSPIMLEPVIEIGKERTVIIKQIKALPTVKRLMRNGRLSAASFTKASTERLTGWLRRFSRLDIAPSKSKLFDNPLRFAREAAGLSMGQIAKVADSMELKDVYNAERCLHPTQEDIDRVLKAIAKLSDTAAGISYPRPAHKNARAYAYAGASQSGISDDDDDDQNQADWEDEGDDYEDY